MSYSGLGQVDSVPAGVREAALASLRAEGLPAPAPEDFAAARRAYDQGVAPSPGWTPTRLAERGAQLYAQTLRGAAMNRLPGPFLGGVSPWFWPLLGVCVAVPVAGYAYYRQRRAG